ncbi:MAG: hypothetical protein HYZ32_03060 [Hydrocarboniphaga effusa]|nr:hypothetical protein [Hydrocarboniphaga effusa]
MIRILQILLLLALAWTIWRVVKNWLAPRPDSRATPEFEPTARCAQCGTHVPRAQLDAAGRCPRCAAK